LYRQGVHFAGAKPHGWGGAEAPGVWGDHERWEFVIAMRSLGGQGVCGVCPELTEG